MKKLSIAFVAAFAIGSATAPVLAADYIPAPPPPSCHEVYGIFAIFHCWHEAHPSLFHHPMPWHHPAPAPAPIRG